MSTAAIMWFRKGLRVHDNPALSAACAAAQTVFPLFIIDPEFTKPGKVGLLRYNFLLESLADLDGSLRARGSRLYVARGKPEDVLPALWKQWDVTQIVFEADSEPYAKVRDANIVKLATTAGVAVDQYHSHTLHKLDMYMTKCRGKPPSSYAGFGKLFGSLAAVPQPLPPVEKIPSVEAARADKKEGTFDLPTLAEMGYPEIEPPVKVLYPGGESAALERMSRHLSKKKWVCEFQKPNTSPNALDPSTTVLSPYLKFGCLSSRKFYHELAKIYKEANGRHSQPPVSLHGQLLWREFFYFSGFAIPNFGKMIGNPVCKQIPWDDNPKLLAAWRNGQTGFPFIDAIMTQLRNEGWIHHLARHAVACFLTRGDLWQSWEKGAAVFEELLLDADWSINSANWMWLSCSSFFYQFFRCYSPVAFGKKTDPEGQYIRKHLPVLRKLPIKYIYEPWKAPLAAQKAAGCIIGQDYPRPIVPDHTATSKENMGRMKAAYDANKKNAGIPDSGRPSKKAKTK